MTNEEYNEQRREVIKEFIDKLDNSSLIDLHNEYCEYNNDPDSHIYPNDEENFNKAYGNKKPYDMALELSGSNYNINNDYVVIGCYGPTSFNAALDINSPVDIDAISSIDVDDLIDLISDANISLDDIKDRLDEIDNEYSISVAKEDFKKEWNEALSKKMPVFQYEDDSYNYINYDEERGVLTTGGATNAGFCLTEDSVEIEVDYDFSLDQNLQTLYDTVMDQHPEKFRTPGLGV